MSGKTGQNKLEQKIHQLEKEVKELRKINEKLSEAKDQFLHFFMISPIATVVTSISSGKIIQVNDAFTTLTGLKKDEIINQLAVGTDFWINKEERRRMLSQLQEKTFIQNYNMQIRTEAGEIREGLFTARIFNICRDQFVISMAKDITRYDQAEAE